MGSASMFVCCHGMIADINKGAPVLLRTPDVPDSSGVGGAVIADIGRAVQVQLPTTNLTRDVLEGAGVWLRHAGMNADVSMVAWMLRIISGTLWRSLTICQ